MGRGLTSAPRSFRSLDVSDGGHAVTEALLWSWSSVLHEPRACSRLSGVCSCASHLWGRWPGAGAAPRGRGSLCRLSPEALAGCSPRLGAGGRGRGPGCASSRERRRLHSLAAWTRDADSHTAPAAVSPCAVREAGSVCTHVLDTLPLPPAFRAATGQRPLRATAQPGGGPGLSTRRGALTWGGSGGRAAPRFAFQNRGTPRTAPRHSRAPPRLPLSVRARTPDRPSGQGQALGAWVSVHSGASGGDASPRPRGQSQAAGGAGPTPAEARTGGRGSRALCPGRGHPSPGPSSAAGSGPVWLVTSGSAVPGRP